jgi:hypothetical protein
MNVPNGEGCPRVFYFKSSDFRKRSPTACRLPKYVPGQFYRNSTQAFFLAGEDLAKRMSDEVVKNNGDYFRINGNPRCYCAYYCFVPELFIGCYLIGLARREGGALGETPIGVGSKINLRRQ